MNISEIFDSSLLDIRWQINGRYILCSFKIKDSEYQIQIEKKPLPYDELKGKRTAEVSFSRNDIDDIEKSHSTTKSSDFPGRIYGIVSNALTKKFEDFDAFYFIANRRHSSSTEEFELKTKIYFMLADRIAKKIGVFFYESKDSSDNIFLVTRERIEKAGMVIEAEEVRKQFKTIIA